MFHDSFNFPFVLDRDRPAERLRLKLENAYLQKARFEPLGCRSFSHAWLRRSEPVVFAAVRKSVEGSC
jgi:hypothetical protein